MPMMPIKKMQAIIEAALMIAGKPLSVSAIQALFKTEGLKSPTSNEIKSILETMQTHYADSGIELQELASGYRFQAKAEFSPWLSKLWEERPPRYSRAFLETLAIIAYEQPITRAEIEAIRGVTVSSNIMRALQEREWVRVIGYREVPGKPALYATTKIFLDYFNLQSLTNLPSLAEFKSFEAQEAQLQVQLALENAQEKTLDSEHISEENFAEIEHTIVHFAEIEEPAENAVAEMSENDLAADDDKLAAS